MRRRIPLDDLLMASFKLLCEALATLVQAEIITQPQALAILAEYGMEPREEERS